MPQMSPLLWLNLFICFSLTFLIFLSINYFIKIPMKIEITPKTIPSLQFKWKW